MGRYTGNACRLLTMISLTSTFFFVEITVGYMTNSLALISDSYHMLSDVVALLVGFASIRISEWHSTQNTYGWVRAEVLGAFVNAVFLTALCFTIFIEALQRLATETQISNPDLLFVIGGTGLFVNIIGLVLFSGIAHGHGHGHGHVGGGPSKVHHIQSNYDELTITVDSDGHITEDQDKQTTLDGGGHAREEPKMDSGAKLNMQGVFLHVLGDALGSVIVVISAVVIKYADGDWKYKFDPIMSLVMVVIIMVTTIPLLKASALVLLQTVPFHIQVRKLQERLLLEVPGVNAVHEFHIWQLAGNRIIASAHILCRNQADYMRIASDVKRFFHNEGIHSTTIQPEFVENVPLPDGMYCVFDCPDQLCDKHTCCGSMKQQLFIHDVKPDHVEVGNHEENIPGSVSSH